MLRRPFGPPWYASPGLPRPTLRVSGVLVIPCATTDAPIARLINGQGDADPVSSWIIMA